MAVNTIKQVSIIPDLPRDVQMVDKTGNLTEHWKLYFEQLNQALQTNFKPEGILLPEQTAANINLLTSVNSKANILYDTTNDVFRGNIQTGPSTYTWFTFVTI